MFVALGVGAYGAGIFHLFTHAFFKALLFLGAGSVIHAVSDEQDMRRMGGLRKHIPITYWMMVIGTLALTGLGIPGTLHRHRRLLLQGCDHRKRLSSATVRLAASPSRCWSLRRCSPASIPGG